MTLQGFINTYNGKAVDVDGYYGDQCMDLANLYVQKVHALPLYTLAQPYARNVYENFESIPARFHFDRIAKGTGSLKPGDIVIWDITVGTAGHIAIFVSGTWTRFTSLDQNWPIDSKTHLQDHDGRGVYGVLRRKGTEQALVDDTIATLAWVMGMDLGTTDPGYKPFRDYWVNKPVGDMLKWLLDTDRRTDIVLKARRYPELEKALKQCQDEGLKEITINGTTFVPKE